MCQLKKQKTLGFYSQEEREICADTHTHTLMILTIVGGVEAADVTDAADPLVHLFF